MITDWTFGQCLTHYPMIKENEKPLQIRVQLSPQPCHVRSIHHELGLGEVCGFGLSKNLVKPWA